MYSVSFSFFFFFLDEIFPDDCPDVVKTSLLKKFTLLIEGMNQRKPVR